LSFDRVVRPVVHEHRIDGDVLERVTVSLCLSEYSFFDKAETLGNRSAASIAHRHADFDAVELPDNEGVPGQGLDGFCHDPAPLVILGEPVADAGRSVVLIDAEESDHADDCVTLDDRRLKAIVVCNLLPRSTDEPEYGVFVRRLCPREPLCEMSTIGGDDATELLRIGFLEEPQVAPTRKFMSEHGGAVSRTSFIVAKQPRFEHDKTLSDPSGSPLNLSPFRQRATSCAGSKPGPDVSTIQ
jgi:hypothetical protein